MATLQCPITGHISGYNGYNHNGCNGDYTTGYDKNMIAGAMLDVYSNLQLYGYVMKFTTPLFVGISESLTLNVAAEDGFGSSGYPELRYAICSSDANKTSYYGVNAPVSDPYQLSTGTITFDLANGATGLCTFTLPITGLAPNTDYYLMLWNGNGTSVTIKSMTTTTWGQPSMYLNYDAHTHSYTSVVTAPTCTAQGYTTYTCSCGDSYVSDYTDALGHNWDSGVVTTEPTYESTGVVTYTCTRCKVTMTGIIPKLGGLTQLVPTMTLALSSGEKRYIPYVYDSSTSTWKICIPYISTDSTFNTYY